LEALPPCYTTKTSADLCRFPQPAQFVNRYYPLFQKKTNIFMRNYIKYQFFLCKFATTYTKSNDTNTGNYNFKFGIP
jgi:hypothetical protein